MSILDRIFVGRVIKDSGTLEEKSFIIGKFKKSLLLVERRGKFKLAFKWSGFALFGGSVTYFDLSTDCLPKLRQFMDEAEQIVKQRATDLGYIST